MGEIDGIRFQGGINVPDSVVLFSVDMRAPQMKQRNSERYSPSCQKHAPHLGHGTEGIFLFFSRCSQRVRMRDITLAVLELSMYAPG